MLSQHASALQGSSAFPIARLGVRLNRNAFSRRTLNIKQPSRAQTPRPILRQEVSRSSPSARLEASIPKHKRRASQRHVVTKASSSSEASFSSPDSSQISLAPVLVAVAIASLGALLFGLHVAIVNGLQDAVSSELGFSANLGLRGAVSLADSVPSTMQQAVLCSQTKHHFSVDCRWCLQYWLVPPLAALQAVAWQMVWAGESPSCCRPSL